MSSERSSILKALGPGILFTGAAVGVSHLVQATRAGAVYGFALIVFVIIANLLKYPAFRFGPLYASATNTSLLEGYRRQGKWALTLYAVLTLGTMFTVQAAVTLVTAGLAKVLFGLDTSPILIAAGLMVVCGLLVATGGYRWLDRVGKVVVSILALSTLIATALVLPTIQWDAAQWFPDFNTIQMRDLAFTAALIGWMPSAIDVAVWQSIWTLARRDQTSHRASAQESSLDFHIGYVSTAILALCFLTLGAGVMHGEGIGVAPQAGRFAAQVIELYAVTLGEWSRPLIAIAAFATMFSTTLTVIDGFPRALAVLFARLQRAEHPDEQAPDRTPAYWWALLILSVGALLILQFFLTSMKALIDLATILSFLSAPFLAWLNHRAATGSEVPETHRPARWLIGYSWIAIAIQGLFAIAFLGMKLS